MRTLMVVALLGASLLVHAVQASEPACERAGGLEFVCGIKNAEDLVLVPGTPWIIASGFAAGAGITLIDSRDGAHSTLYPGDSPRASHDARFAACSTPPAPAQWLTHGLNLRPGANGHSTLYAVGHGAREAIEVFDVDATGARPALTWQGCVPMPEGLSANSVASFADGSLVATVLLMPGKTFPDVFARKTTGAVFASLPDMRGFELIRGSELSGQQRHRGLARTAARSLSRRPASRRSSRFRTRIRRSNCARLGRCRSRRTMCIAAPTGACSRPV